MRNGVSGDLKSGRGSGRDCEGSKSHSDVYEGFDSVVKTGLVVPQETLMSRRQDSISPLLKVQLFILEHVLTPSLNASRLRVLGI